MDAVKEKACLYTLMGGVASQRDVCCSSRHFTVLVVTCVNKRDLLIRFELHVVMCIPCGWYSCVLCLPAAFTCHVLLSTYTSHTVCNVCWRSGAPSVLFLIQSCYPHSLNVPCAENCALLCYYSATSNFLQTFRENLSVPYSGIKLKKVPIGCPKTSVRNYNYWLSNNPVVGYFATEA